MADLLREIETDMGELEHALEEQRLAVRRYDRFRARWPWRYLPERAWVGRILGRLWRIEDRIRHEVSHA